MDAKRSSDVIEFMPESSGNVIGVRAVGMLTDTDYKETLIPKLETLFEQCGELNLLIYMDDDFEGWDLEAAWDDMSFGLKHRADFRKLAVVGGPRWVEWCFKLSGFLMKGEIKLFPVSSLDKAWRWVRD
jgi:SpoIIAA-like